MGRFNSKTAVITGSGRRGGLGEAIAKKLASEGANIVISDIGKSRDASTGADHIGSSDEMETIQDSILLEAEQQTLMADVPLADVGMATPKNKREMYRPREAGGGSSLKKKVGEVRGSSLAAVQIEGLVKHYPHMEKEDIEGLVRLFQLWDTDKSGAISIQEMALILER